MHHVEVNVPAHVSGCDPGFDCDCDCDDRATDCGRGRDYGSDCGSDVSTDEVLPEQGLSSLVVVQICHGLGYDCDFCRDGHLGCDCGRGSQVGRATRHCGRGRTHDPSHAHHEGQGCGFEHDLAQSAAALK